MTSNASSQEPQRHHGGFKVPGGKLVVVDLESESGVISAASINGDFFLEPDTALEDLNRSLIGLSVNADHQTIREAIHNGLPEGTHLIGFDAQAVAMGVRRALGHATRWRDHDWHIIPQSVMSPEMNVALDEVLTREVAAGTRPPTIRFWNWDTPAVVIGSFQAVHNELNAEAAERHGIRVVRRISGGGAMFMEAGNCITYSLYAPPSLVDGKSFADSYPYLDAWVMEALERVGIEAFYKPLNDIATPQGKIGGAAQKRLASGALLHHVTMSYDIDADKMSEVLTVSEEKISDKGIKSAKKRVDPLKRQTGMTRDAIIDVMMETFTERYDATPSTIGEQSLAKAKALVESKFGTHEWTYRLP
ncbi:lipoyl protein ligase domain-containing protein [Neomicrococcus lactis]